MDPGWESFEKAFSHVSSLELEKGGPGSGNFGHHGNFGHVGGSGPSMSALQVRQAKPKEFHSAFEKALKGSPFTNHVSHYSPEELAGMKTIVMTPDGKAGYAVKDHGDGRVEMTALYSTSSERGLGIKLLLHGMKAHGVNYVECFGPRLNVMYEAAGFKVDQKFPFDPSQAPKNWDEKKFGRPDYFTMRAK